MSDELRPIGRRPAGGQNPNSTRPQEGGVKTIKEAWLTTKHRKFSREEKRVNNMSDEALRDHLFPVELDIDLVREGVEKHLGHRVPEKRLAIIKRLAEKKVREEERLKPNPLFDMVLSFRDDLGLGLTNLESYRLAIEVVTRLFQCEKVTEEEYDELVVDAIVDFTRNWGVWMDGLPRAEHNLAKITSARASAENTHPPPPH